MVTDAGGVQMGAQVSGVVLKGKATVSFPMGGLVDGQYAIRVSYVDDQAAPNFKASVGASAVTLTIR